MVSSRSYQKWLHGNGLVNTLQALDQFLDGRPHEQLWVHWIAYANHEPFAYLLTSNIDPNEEDYKKYVSHPQSKVISLDLFICNLNYLGKGLAVPMIKEFLKTRFPDVTDVFIDPEATNTRAIHVYEKVGFKKIKEYIASWHPVPHFLMHFNAGHPSAFR